MKFRWHIPEPAPLLAERLARECSISPLLAEILIQRNLGSPVKVEGFLRPRLQQLADPFLLPQMGMAVDRLVEARTRQEPVVVFGDYDVDGVTATALLLELLEALGFSVSHYLPHRLEEGYGLSREAVENCLRKHPSRLLLAVDCGSSSAEVVDGLAQRGVDTLILDHHQPGDPVPKARALVNPKAWTSPVVFHDLCSAGLAFKLAHALVKRGRQLEWPEALRFDLKPLLEWVALGTIADLVPLTEENRILVTGGLKRLETSSHPGIQALKRVAGCRATLGSYEIGFQLGPRLNAAGRLETAEAALRLLRCQDPGEAGVVAAQLDECNRERQEIERKITRDAIDRIRTQFNPAADYVIVEGAADWHIGVVGIVASKVLQEFYRPTIIVGGEEGALRGSGRSIEGFDLAEALRQCGDLLERHGGHAMAAGVTVQPEKLLDFKRRLNDLARARLQGEPLMPRLKLDAVVRCDQLQVETLEELAQLAPTGVGNPELKLCLRGVRVVRGPHKIGAEGQHLKFWIQDSHGTAEVLWWHGAQEPFPSGRFDLAFIPTLNEYQGRRTVQLKLADWRPAATG